MQKKTKETVYCWICGNEANSREHKIKRSDIKQVLGEATQQKPIYIHDAQSKNKKVQSTNSKILKGNKDLCTKCNSEKTQPHDRAWEKLSSYLNNNWSSISSSGGFRMAKVFQNGASKGMLEVHLYFAKVMGCAITEAKSSIDIKPLANGILSVSSIPKFWIALGATPDDEYMKTVGRTDLMVLNDKKNNIEVAATLLYTYDEFSILIEYSTSEDIEYNFENNWHPSKGTKIFRLSDLKK